jgi:hypothetical protein
MRRPLSALAAAGTAAHHGYELRAGVGLVFEPFLGRRGAVALWSVALPLYAFWALTGRRERLVAHANGSALAGGLVHFVLWPWQTRNGIPTLTEAEGLTEAELPAYNRVLHLWIAAAALALAGETAPGAGPAAVAGLLTFEPLRRSARHHFGWAREQAQREPERWSPALREVPPVR